MHTQYFNSGCFRKPQRGHRQQRGMGLLAAIALAFSIAIAAIALSALLAHRDETERGGLNRSIAVMGSYSIIDTLRADRAAAIAGAFNLAPGASLDTHTAATASQLAAWREQLVLLLGDGASGGVECKGPTCIVTVRWLDRQSQGEMVQHIETEVRL